MHKSKLAKYMLKDALLIVLFFLVVNVAVPNGARADIIFVNNTNGEVTDLHFKVQPTRIGQPRIPLSDPWGKGTATEEGDVWNVEYKGDAIPIGGRLTLLDINFAKNTVQTSAIWSDFTWTPGGECATPSASTSPRLQISNTADEPLCSGPIEVFYVPEPGLFGAFSLCALGLFLFQARRSTDARKITSTVGI